MTGALAGAAYGAQDIPSAWTSPFNGLVPGDDEPAATDRESLEALAFRLLGRGVKPLAALGPPLPLVEVAPHLFATDLTGTIGAGGFAVVSLCRTDGLLEPARQVWLIDSEDPGANPRLATAVADAVAEIERVRGEGRDVLVHCHHGRSRSGLVIRAWLQTVRGLSHGEALNAALAISDRFTPWNRTFESYLMEL